MVKHSSGKNIAIKFSSLDIGGIQSVIMSQIDILKGSGHNVVVVLSKNDVHYDIPEDVRVEVLPLLAEDRLSRWRTILEGNKVDSYFDHGILYDEDWVGYSEVARDLGVKSIAWIHNAFTRPILDFSEHNIFLDKHIDVFDQVVVLSEEDVIYYKLLGHRNVRFLPNPMPQLLVGPENQKKVELHKQNESLELIWVGRAHQSTKRILDLIPFMVDVVAHVPYAHLSVVGPFTWDITEEAYVDAIERAGLGSNISIIGEVAQGDLSEYYKKSDIAISTSVIEGFPITLVEESSFGIPIVMYDLPWLWITKDNSGIKSVPQGDYSALAREVVDIATDTDRYVTMSKAAIKKACELRKIDFMKLYDLLLKNALPAEYDVQLSLDQVKKTLQMINSFYGQIRGIKQGEIDLLREDNLEKQRQLDNIASEVQGYLGIKRSSILLLGNIKRKLRIRTRIKNLKLTKRVVGFYKRNKKIRVAVLVSEFFANDMPYCNGKGGYGVVARNYLAEHIPNRRIVIDTICGFSEGDKLLTHVVDGRKKVLFLPANKENNEVKIRDIVNRYDVFLSIEFQDIAKVVMQTASRGQRLIYYIQDPRPEEDWVELDSVKRFRAIGYRPNEETSNLMNSLYSSGRLVAISQGRDFIDKARSLYALPNSFSAEFIPNAVDIPEVSISEIKSKDNTIVSLARLDIVKRPWIIGEVAKRLPEYNFVFAGQIHDKEMEGVMRPYLSLPNVINLGHIEREEKDELLRKSKILINTSIHECIPVSFLEALSYGMLIVSNRNPDNLTKNFGSSVDQVNGDGYEQVDALVDSIKRLIENDSLRVDAAKRAVDYVKEVHGLDEYTKKIRSAIVEAYNMGIE